MDRKSSILDSMTGGGVFNPEVAEVELEAYVQARLAAAREDLRKCERALAHLSRGSREREEKLREALREALDSIVWMSGSPSFAPDGEAHEGWVITRDKLDRLFALAGGGAA